MEVVPMIDVVDRSVEFASDENVKSRLERFRFLLERELRRLFESATKDIIKGDDLVAHELDGDEIFIEVFSGTHQDAWRNMLTVIVENRMTEQKFVCTPLQLRAMPDEQNNLLCDEKWSVNLYSMIPDENEVSGFKTKYEDTSFTEVVWWHPSPVVVAIALFANIQSCIWHNASSRITFPQYYHNICDGKEQITTKRFIDAHNSYHNSMDEKRFAAKTLLDVGFSEHKIHELLK